MARTYGYSLPYRERGMICRIAHPRVRRRAWCTAAGVLVGRAQRRDGLSFLLDGWRGRLYAARLGRLETRENGRGRVHAGRGQLRVHAFQMRAPVVSAVRDFPAHVAHKPGPAPKPYRTNSSTRAKNSRQ